MTIVQHPSPNLTKGKISNTILVIHATASDTSSLAYLCSRASKVSAHFLIERDGTIYQLVNENDTAWHAGESTWAGKTDLNVHSIGIEVACAPESQYTNQELASLKSLCSYLVQKYKFKKENVVGHDAIALPKGRKTDPYSQFPWKDFLSFLYPTSTGAEQVHPALEIDENEPSPWAKVDVEYFRSKGLQLKNPMQSLSKQEFAVSLRKLFPNL